MKVPGHGDLFAWADQGVLLLNASLTVRAGDAGAHQNKGWETFTDAVIQQLSSKREHLVFMLWGRYAKNKASMGSPAKHCILTAAHPSPFSADKGFWGCRHFSKANEYLIEHGIETVDWGL